MDKILQDLQPNFDKYVVQDYAIVSQLAESAPISSMLN
jgi:hypothetical protein